MAVPAILAALRSVSSVAGKKLFSPSAVASAEKAGATSALAQVRSSLRKTVRDQASNIRTGRRYDGVTTLKLDPDARANFDYDELADRVLKGESPNVAAREMLFRDATQLTLGDVTLTGEKARQAAEEVTAWNRGVKRLRNGKGFKAGGVEFTPEDLDELAGEKRTGNTTAYQIDTKYMKGTNALDTIRDTTPREVVVARDDRARKAYLKGLRSANLPESLQGAIMEKVNALSPSGLAGVLRSLPVVKVTYFSSEIAMKAQVRKVLGALGINPDDHIEAVEEFENA